MDSTALRLLFRPENQWWLGYLGWILQNGSLSLSVSEPETPTRLIQEPEPENTKSPETKHADQSTIEPEADMNLIDLGSGPIWRPSSSDVLVGFPSPISSAGFGQIPGFVSPIGDVQILGSASIASSIWLISLASGFTSTNSTPLGSLIHPNKPRSVVAQHPPQTSGSQAMPRPSTPSASPGASLPLVSPSSLLALSSLYLSLKPVASPWVSTLLMSPWSVGLCAPPVPALTLVQPLVTGFRVLPSPLPKAPPWFLPRQAEGTLHNTEFVEVEV
ncbi:leucine-rich repeat extensin 5 [Labeo rohita]|uniref:Leucine-rich repeat extensin 5 n=1 Tax=Labeo rohita TaxID=84645 RepID=A0A498L8I8_LABRO|nr:leucine-rich repeat extensin 5 [Labeo rohita]RXN11181.1 leucine-rich repeat extensin 5 [Labeo rohita]